MAMVTKDRYGASKCVNHSSSTATTLPNVSIVFEMYNLSNNANLSFLHYLNSLDHVTTGKEWNKVSY